MTRQALRLTALAAAVGSLAVACTSMNASMPASVSLGEPDVVHVQMPAGSEFSNGPSTPGGAEKASLPSGSEFSSGPASGGGAKKGALPSGSEFSNGPK